MAVQKRGIGPFFENLAVRSFLRVALLMPYRHRVRFVGWAMSRIVSPLAGYDRRILENLDYVFPDMPGSEKQKIMREVPNNVGRSIIEIYSGKEFIDRVKDLPLAGAGAEPLAHAHANHRPVILVTGHFGNYDVPRAALIARGYNVGALYNPMRNTYFNEHYEQAIKTIGTPIFRRGRKGFGQLLRFLKSGGMVGFLVDQHMHSGAPLQFFGKPAATALSAAELALKYGALLVPIYGVRKENGLDFEIVVEAPIPHSDPVTMTQALNDSLEEITRSHPDQWFWVHKRWKLERAPRA